MTTVSVVSPKIHPAGSTAEISTWRQRYFCLENIYHVSKKSFVTKFVESSSISIILGTRVPTTINIDVKSLTKLLQK